MFVEFEYLSAVRDFLLQYPYPAPWNEILIDHGAIVERQGSDRWGEGAALISNGDILVSRRRSVTGRETQRKRTNFSLIMWRATNDDEFRRDIANFINRFINWVNEENIKRGTISQNPYLPILSMTDFENISADGGIRTAQIDGQRSEFSIQIHSDYEIVF